MTHALPKFSVVINTLNRAQGLAATLASFRQLRYDGAFEVIVVNGPSTDATEAVLETYAGDIRVARCPVPNLSMSRNIGIDLSAGEVVAFIDDDAIPEPEWLAQLADGYDCSDVGAVGGAVFDQTGHSMQYVYSTANRLGNADWKAARATPDYCFPFSYNFPYLQGTNTSFRRSVLERIGGFDEEIEFYLDETEVCCRMVDAGYLIRQVPNAFVHHKFAPSHIRDTNKITRHRYPIIKNKLYFSLKHGQRFHALAEIIEDNQRFIAQQRADVEFHVQGGRLAFEEHALLSDQIDAAWRRGMERGLSAVSEPERRRAPQVDDFVRFEAEERADRLHIVLVSKDFPPNHSGGIARFNFDLARGLAAMGHIVHVMTVSHDIDRVDLEAGVWVHRLVLDPGASIATPENLRIPPAIAAWSATARREVELLAKRRRIDVIEAPIWDCEGIAFLVEPRWPVVVSLQTSLAAWLDNHPEMRSDAPWMDDFGKPMLALERFVMTRASRLRAISQAILTDLEIAYEVRLTESADVQPLGLLDWSAASPKSSPSSGPVTVLFVGRLEKRKGIDALLESIPMTMARTEDAVFRIIGDDSLINERGVTYRSEFVRRHRDEPWFDRVSFEGKVDDATLDDAYRNADLLVAPSRYESFGLIFVEAMRAGIAAIGCLTGGVPEVVADGESGLLVAIDAPSALSEATVRLVDDANLRESMGQHARRRYMDRFTATRMAADSDALYRAGMKAFANGAIGPQ